jgi:hypothetical protein
VTNPTQRPLPDNTQQSEEKDIHAVGGIRTRKSDKLAAADPRLRPRGCWDAIQSGIQIVIFMDIVVWSKIITLVNNLILKVEVDIRRTPISYCGRLGFGV